MQAWKLCYRPKRTLSDVLKRKRGALRLIIIIKISIAPHLVWDQNARQYCGIVVIICACSIVVFICACSIAVTICL